MKLRIYCLSLPRSHERRIRFEAEAGRVGLKFEYCDGLDASRLPSAQLAALVDQSKAVEHFGRPLGLAEIACAEGHRTIYRALVAGEDDAAVVLEDDVTLDDTLVDVLNGLKKLDRELAGRPALCLLGGAWIRRMPLLISRRHPVEITRGHNLFRVLKSDGALYGAYAYWISRPAAVAILQSERLISVPADAWDFFWKNRMLQDVWLLEPQAAYHRADFTGSLLVGERRRLEGEQAAGRRQPVSRRLLGVLRSPRRLMTSLAARLGWLQIKTVLYSLWSHLC